MIRWPQLTLLVLVAFLSIVHGRQECSREEASSTASERVTQTAKSLLQTVSRETPEHHALVEMNGIKRNAGRQGVCACEPIQMRSDNASSFVSVKRFGSSGALTPFDCTGAGTAGVGMQIIKSNDGNSASIFTFNIATSRYDLLSPLSPEPSNWKEVNGAGIDNGDSMGYATVKTDTAQWYLSRFGKNGNFEVLGSLPGDAWFAGTTDFNDDMWLYSNQGMLCYIPSPSSMVGADVNNAVDLSITPTGPGGTYGCPMTMDHVAAGSYDVVKIADLASYTVASGDQFVIGLRPSGQAMIINVGTNAMYLIDTLAPNIAPDGFGSAWDFMGTLYFSANDGSGVFKVDPYFADLTQLNNVTVSKVNGCQESAFNDGLNCMTMAKLHDHGSNRLTQVARVFATTMDVHA